MWVGDVNIRKEDIERLEAFEDMEKDGKGEPNGASDE